MTHPDELTLQRMVDGELTRERKVSTRNHLIDCARCQADYEALKTETELFRAALREDPEPLPSALNALENRPGFSWFMAVALALGALGLSSFWSTFVTPMLEGMDSMGLDGSGLLTTVVIRGLLYRGWTNMISTATEIVTLTLFAVALAAASIWAIRNWHRFRSTALAVTLSMTAGTVVVLGIPARTEGAVRSFHHETYILGAGDTIANDLIVGAEAVRIEGTVTGDLIVAARMVEVSGTIGGDILGFAEEVDITGRVEGSVRTGSRTLDIEGVVSRNVTAAGETIRLRPGGEIGGSFTAACREAILSAPVARDLLILAETHELDSSVGGSATLAGGRLTIGDGASIEGPIEFRGRAEPSVSPHARLGSPVDFKPLERREHRSPFAWLSRFVYFWAAAFVLGAAFILVAPRAAEVITAVHMSSHGKSLLVGLLSACALFALSIALLVTIVGIPLGLVTLALFATGLYLGQAYAGLYVGGEILGRPTDRSQLLVRLAVGLLAIHILQIVPFAGKVVEVAVALWGFGALSLWVFDVFQRATPVALPPAPATAPASPSP
jgi:cytoskeletal protein CcmA (bactofilin family)